MAKAVATPKQTGGGGFTFEDKVAARFLLLMLAGRAPLEPENGIIKSVGFQTRVDGWLLDDLLLNLHGDGADHHFALSVKSNRQITESGFPADFVRSIWEQWLKNDSDAFKADTDYLGLASDTLEYAVRTAWHSLLAKAMRSSPSNFAERLATAGYANDVERALFRSLRCPTDIGTDASTDDSAVAGLVQRIRVLDFDFANTPSHHEAECVALCRDVLRNGAPTEALSLWRALTHTAREFASAGGLLRRDDLIADLRAKFSLQQHPDYRPDWERIRAASQSTLDMLRETVGGHVAFDRAQEQKEIESRLRKGRMLVLLGASGSGKSVLAKRISTSIARDGEILWLDSEALNVSTPDEVSRAIGLTFSLEELLRSTATDRSLIVFDGLERFSGGALKIARIIAQRALLGSDASPWLIIGTCVPEHWEAVFRHLVSEGVDPNAVDALALAYDFSNDLLTIQREFPQLRPVLLQRGVRDLFRNLKILDLVASYSGLQAGESAKWVGESDVIRWFWERHVSTGTGGLERSRVLQKLATIEADELFASIPPSRLDSEECRIAEALGLSHLCLRIAEGIRFEHDLFAHWARQQCLLEDSDVAARIRERVTNPRWHRAIRLTGLHLLEAGDRNVQQWRALVRDLAGPSGLPTQESDLILEAVIFAADPTPLLQIIWPFLVADEGRLLGRFLGRFLHVATLPNPAFAWRTDHGDEDAATVPATIARIPYWPLWFSVLPFVHSKRLEAVRLCPDLVSALAETGFVKEALTGPSVARLQRSQCRPSIGFGREFGTASGTTGPSWIRRYIGDFWRLPALFRRKPRIAYAS